METWKKFTKYKESAKIYIEINKKNAKKCKKMQKNVDFFLHFDVY